MRHERGLGACLVYIRVALNIINTLLHYITPFIGIALD